MPTSLNLPDLPIGHIVQGDVVLRNVVVDTAPSTRVKTPPALQPATPLVPSLPYTPPAVAPKTGNYPKKAPSPPQYAPDLRIPQNLPANAFSVFIDKKDQSIIKADMQDTPLLLQQDFYFIGAFDSATADAVIKDMIDNPMPSLDKVIDDYMNKAIPLAMGSYLSGLVIFQALKNAKENRGSFIGFDDRVSDAMISTKIPTFAGKYNSYPKSATISVCYTGTATLENGLNSAVAFFVSPRSLTTYGWSARPEGWGNKVGRNLGDMSFKILGNDGNEFIIANGAQETSLLNYLVKLNDVPNLPFVYSAKFAFKTSPQSVNLPPAQPSLSQLTSNVANQLTLPSNVSPQVKELTQKYVAINTLLQKMEAQNAHFDIVGTQPLTNEELVDLYEQGKASIQNVVNPNANKSANDPTRVMWVTINLPDGRSAWRSDPSVKRGDCVKIEKVWLDEKTSVDLCHLPDGKVLDTSTPILPALVPNPDIVKGTFKLADDYVRLSQASNQIGQQLGVPAGCQPINPTILPPVVVPSTCKPKDDKNVRRTDFDDIGDPKIYELPPEKMPDKDQPYSRAPSSPSDGSSPTTDQSYSKVANPPSFLKYTVHEPTKLKLPKIPAKDDSYIQYKPDNVTPPTKATEEPWYSKPETGGPFPRWEPPDDGFNPII